MQFKVFLYLCGKRKIELIYSQSHSSHHILQFYGPVIFTEIQDYTVIDKSWGRKLMLWDDPLITLNGFAAQIKKWLQEKETLWILLKGNSSLLNFKRMCPIVG